MIAKIATLALVATLTLASAAQASLGDRVCIRTPNGTVVCGEIVIENART